MQRDNDGISLQSMDRSSGSKAAQPEYIGDMKDTKGPGYIDTEEVPAYDGEEVGEVRPVEDAKDLVTKVIHVDDDPSINPWCV
jgi:hypothetical protein